MDARSFYGSRRATKVTTIAEAYDAVENNKNVVSIVVLPPIDGDSGRKESDCEYVTSDTEDMFEPAGEIEVEEEIDSGDKLTVPLSPPKKKSRKDAPKWKKSVSSDKSLPPSRSNVAENILVLDSSTPYQTWEKIFSCSMLNHIVLQTNLYAQRDKNSPNFSLSGGDVRKLLGIILFLAITLYPKSNIIGRHNLIWVYQLRTTQWVENAVLLSRNLFILPTIKISKRVTKWAESHPCMKC